MAQQKPTDDDDLGFELGFEPTTPSIVPPTTEEDTWLDTARRAAAFGIRGGTSLVPGLYPGALAGGLGEFAAQSIEPREDYNWPQMGAQATLGAIPFGRTAGVLRMGLKGAAMGAGATGLSQFAETGELPTAGQVAFGAGAGGLGGAATAKFFKGRLGKIGAEVGTPKTGGVTPPPSPPITAPPAAPIKAPVETQFDIAKNRQTNEMLTGKTMAGLTDEDIRSLNSVDDFGNLLSREDQGLLPGEPTPARPPVEPWKGVPPPTPLPEESLGQFQRRTRLNWTKAKELYGVPPAPGQATRDAAAAQASKPLAQQLQESLGAGTSPISPTASPSIPIGTKIVIKEPIAANTALARQRGFVSDPTLRSKTGGPMMRYDPAEAAKRVAGKKKVPTGPPKLRPEEPQLIPFEREVTLPKPGIGVLKKMEKNFVITAAHPNGDVTFKFNQPPPKLPEEINKLREAWNLSRGLMAVDPPFITSAAFRQAAPLAWSKAWRKSWVASAKAYREQDLFDKVQSSFTEHPRFQNRVDAKTGTIKPSMAEEAKLAMTDLASLTSREEVLASKWAETGGFLAPRKGEGRLQRLYSKTYGRHVRASNRAYTAFLNKLRFDTFNTMMDNAVKQSKALNDPSLNPERNLVAAKEIASFINDATGRGSLTQKIPFTGKGTFGGKQISLEGERSAAALRETLFSPRLMARTVRMLNPSNYVTAHPEVRKAYLKSMITMTGNWMLMAGLAKGMGADVSLDPTSTDFGKIKIGNTRLDPAAGFQQYLVLMARMARGATTSSTSGETYEFGRGYKPETAGSTVQRFVGNKLQPNMKLIWDIGWAAERQPVYLGDRILQEFAPMMLGDILEVMQDDPTMLGPTILFSGIGGGAQTYGGKEYDESEIPKPTLTPFLGLEEMDIRLPRGEY